MKPETLLKYGWSPIVSDAQAAQLLRRQIKAMANQKQRCSDYPFCMRYLLAFKKGNWYKFLRNSENDNCRILLRRMVPD